MCESTHTCYSRFLIYVLLEESFAISIIRITWSFIFCISLVVLLFCVGIVRCINELFFQKIPFFMHCFLSSEIFCFLLFRVGWELKVPQALSLTSSFRSVPGKLTVCLLHAPPRVKGHLQDRRLMMLRFSLCKFGCQKTADPVISEDYQSAGMRICLVDYLIELNKTLFCKWLLISCIAKTLHEMWAHKNL